MQRAAKRNLVRVSHTFVCGGMLQGGLKSLMWLALLMMLLVYIAALVATQLIGHSPEWEGMDGEDVRDWFGTVPRSSTRAQRCCTVNTPSAIMAHPPFFCSVHAVSDCDARVLVHGHSQACS